MTAEPVVSQHRLPRGYRLALVLLWVTPPALLLLTIILIRGITPALLDLRLIAPMLVMGVPALYLWNEGVDVLPGGLVARVHVPRYYPFEGLGTWYYDARPERRVLTVWDSQQHKVLELRAGHLTDLPVLLRTLHQHVRPRIVPR